MLKNKFPETLIFFLILFIVFVYPKNSFDIQKISPTFMTLPNVQLEQNSVKENENIHSLLQQTFSYLDEGGQSYAFISDDRKYVLKFFKFDRFRPSPLVDYLPEVSPFKEYKQHHILKREKKLNTVYNGYKLGYDHHKLESGLIFVQLQPSLHSYFVTIIDQQGREMKVDLETIPFVLQKKGEMFSTHLSHLLEKGNLPLAKERIAQLKTLYLAEYAKGLHDIDLGIMHNIGYADDELFHLDVGKFVYDENIKNEEIYKKELALIHSKIELWIKKFYPEYSARLFDKK